MANAAAKIDKFKSVKVRNYQLELDGEIFQITDLERVPKEIRPSTLASPRSDTHLAFFSRYAVFSNHFPSKFTIQGQSFTSMEHFLALKRAELSVKEDLIRKARGIQDPVQAKHILNSLHNDHQEEWDSKREEVAKEGLRPKFLQNPRLQDYLRATGNLSLGEASTNTTWGVGMDLNNPEVLNGSKWLENGNLLGRLLMNLRKELPPIQQPSTK